MFYQQDMQRLNIFNFPNSHQRLRWNTDSSRKVLRKSPTPAGDVITQHLTTVVLGGRNHGQGSKIYILRLLHLGCQSPCVVHMMKAHF